MTLIVGGLWLLFIRIRPAGTPGPSSGVAELPSPRQQASSLASSMPAPQATSYDSTALEAALRTAWSQATACPRDGTPAEAARVTLTFSPDGKVSDARIDGLPNSVSPLSRCILDVLRAARIPPFPGSAFVVTRSIALR